MEGLQLGRWCDIGCRVCHKVGGLPEVGGFDIGCRVYQRVDSLPLGGGFDIG